MTASVVPTEPVAPAKPRSRWIWGCLIAVLVVASLCGYNVLRRGLAFISNGKRPAKIGREVKAKLAPGMTLREALVLSYGAGRDEPETAMGNPLAFVWAHCTTATRPADDSNGGPRIYLFVASKGSASPGPASQGGLPLRLSMDQPGATPIDTESAVGMLSRCPHVEIVFESGFFGWVYLPVLVTPDGHLASVGEIYTAAK